MSRRGPAFQVDQYRDAILEARAKGAPVSGIARTLGFSPQTVFSALERWDRPERADPGAEALDALRRLVDGE